mmetsp:Transcript_9943/g.18481  ORF Transcript_9943/g.18481 Transcript_9943/m.18481 type:complete len:312 (+) Transcript_9943:92-1027(+)
MSCLSIPRAAKMQAFKLTDRHSDTESTAASEHSDIETVESSCSSALPSPRSSGMADVCKDDEQGPCSVIVKGTFIDLNDSRSLLQRYRRLRRCMTDSVLAGAFAEEEAYEPGKFSDECAASAAAEEASRLMVEENHGSATAVAEPVKHVRQAESQGENGKKRENNQASKQACGRTTVMLRNVPNNYTRDMFLTLLDEHGFSGRYDFVYLPCDFYRNANLGYAFVNLTDEASVDALWSTFDGFSGWALPTAKVCQVSWSGPHQGFKAHVERYRNSPVMHRSVPDEYKPVIFEHGLRKNFPRPTKKVKAPTGC